VDIVVIGAGLAGLAAAVELQEAGHAVAVLEAADAPGGRVRTDKVDGHLLDRGFQVVLTAYPELRHTIDVDRLDIRSFEPGALVRLGDGLHRVADPRRRPASALDTVRSPIGSPLDKARILRFLRATSKGTVAELWRRPETTAFERFRRTGFSNDMIDRFLRPLFASITLDPDLSGSSRVVEFVFRMLASGAAGVPATGMQAIPDQLAGELADGALHVSTPVVSATATAVTLADGQRVEGDAVIVATDASTAAELCGTPDHGWRSTTTVWFRAPRPPVTEPVLVLSGEGVSPIGSLAVLSQIAPGYAPAGVSTVAVSSPGTGAELLAAMRATLRDWFGPMADTWEVLRVDQIDKAHPIRPLGSDHIAPLQLSNDLWVCGDHRRDPSINGALASGRSVARAVLARNR
jgi:phytoene dehydrogenase-like protein